MNKILPAKTTLMNLIHVLQNVAMFQALTDEERAFLEANAARRCNFSPGRVIFIEGSPSDSFSVVETGEIEIIKSLGGEAERVSKRIGPGDYYR